MAETAYPFLKGHGTENDFVLLPDHDGTVHGELDVSRVTALCERRAGLGGDGVLRVIRTAAYDALDCSAGSRGQDAEWFMDYRNSDGSSSQMCGNGIRVFVRHLLDAGLIDAPQVRAGVPVPIGTRDGVKLLRLAGDDFITEMGQARVLGETFVTVGDRTWPAVQVDLGNPHAVAFVDDLADPGRLHEPPTHDPALYPEGVNVEFVVRRGERHVAMRVHERGSGETRSCGTGACAVAVAAALADGVGPQDEVTYRVDVPGGSLWVTRTATGGVRLTGPAVVVASGTTSL